MQYATPFFFGCPSLSSFLFFPRSFSGVHSLKSVDSYIPLLSCCFWASSFFFLPSSSSFSLMEIWKPKGCSVCVRDYLGVNLSLQDLPAHHQALAWGWGLGFLHQPFRGRLPGPPACRLEVLLGPQARQKLSRRLYKPVEGKVVLRQARDQPHVLSMRRFHVRASVGPSFVILFHSRTCVRVRTGVYCFLPPPSFFPRNSVDVTSLTSLTCLLLTHVILMAML